MKNKFRKFINGNGFLVFLFICVCIVSFSTIFMLTKDTGDNKKDRDKESYKESLEDQENKKDDISNEGEDKEKPELGEDKDKEVINASQEGDKRDVDKEIEGEEKVDEVEDEDMVEDPDEEDYIETSKALDRQASFIMPLSGEVITEFSKDSLIYSKTLEEWRAHTGLDIKGNIGSKVVAVADGQVKDLYEDLLWGYLVLIDHGNGIQSKYANLDSNLLVKKGQSLKQGDVIGSVGKSANIEILMDDHLHFEIIRDGKNIDPRSITQ